MRKLDNKSENLVLADAWGNVIDQVLYSDSSPWPTEADGHGPFLQLKNLDSDNSLAENWTTSNDLVGVKEFYENQNIVIYPNPTLGKIHITLSENANSCQILNLTGNVVEEIVVSSPRLELDLNHLPSGVYLIKVQMVDGKMDYKKVVKH